LAGATVIWLMFVGTYLGRIPRNAVYALPVGATAIALSAYLFGLRGFGEPFSTTKRSS